MCKITMHRDFLTFYSCIRGFFSISFRIIPIFCPSFLLWLLCADIGQIIPSHTKMQNAGVLSRPPLLRGGWQIADFRQFAWGSWCMLFSPRLRPPSQVRGAWRLERSTRRGLPRMLCILATTIPGQNTLVGTGVPDGPKKPPVSRRLLLILSVPVAARLPAVSWHRCRFAPHPALPYPKDRSRYESAHGHIWRQTSCP